MNVILLWCCICDFVFVSFVHSCIARVAGLLSDLAFRQTKTRDYLILGAARLQAALHFTFVCRPLNYIYGQHWEHTRNPSQPTDGPDDRGFRNVSGFSTARANVQLRRVIPRARLHVNSSRWQVALRSSLRCKVSVNWKASATTAASVTESKVSRNVEHLVLRTNRAVSDKSTGTTSLPRSLTLVSAAAIAPLLVLV